MARKKKQKHYIVKNLKTLDFFKGFDPIKGYTAWTYNTINAMRMDNEEDAQQMSNKLNEDTEVVVDYVD